MRAGEGVTTFDYDGAGRQIRQGDVTLQFDGLDQLVRVVRSADDPGVVHGYGHDGLRVYTNDSVGGNEVWFSPDVFERDGVRSHYIRVGERLVARIDVTWVNDGAHAGAAAGTDRSVSVARVDWILALLIVLVIAGISRRSRWPRMRRAAVPLLALSGCSLFNAAANPLWQRVSTTYYHVGVGAGPTLMTREDGTVVEERRFEPFGDDIDAYRESPSGSAEVGLVDFAREAHGILNKPTDPSTGWSYHGARWLSAETARWLVPDPPTKAPDDRYLVAPGSCTVSICVPEPHSLLGS